MNEKYLNQNLESSSLGSENNTSMQVEKSTNKFTAIYKLYAIGDNEVLTEIESKQFKDSDTETEILPRVLRHSIHDTDINIMYRGNNEILTEIQPVGSNNIEIEIDVRPHNRMVAIYEIQQPPIVDDINNPTKDAFNRSEGIHATINNGTGTSMVVGKVNGENWDSYMRFDLSHIDESLYILGAKLRLYYTGTFQDLDLELFELVENWGEYSITYLNSPDSGRKLNSKYVRNIEGRYIDIDVSDIVLEWIFNPHKNFGFKLKASDASNDGQMIFRTRESHNPPELIVSHYSTEVFSTGRSEIITEIASMKADVSEKEIEIEVGSTFNMNEMDTQIYVHVKGIPIEDEVEVEVTASNRYIGSLITVSPIKEDDINSEISVISGKLVNIINAELSVSNDKCLIEIYSSNIDDKITELNVTNDHRLSEITVSRLKEELELTVRVSDNSELNSEISVYSGVIESIKDTEITISKNMCLVEIYSSNIDDKLTEINISNDARHSEITVSRLKEELELTVRAIDNSNVLTEITSSKDFTLIEITAMKFYDIETEIEVNDIRKNEHDVEITVSRLLEHVEITPRIVGKNEIYTQVTVSNPNILVEIRTPEQSNIDTEIDVLPQSSIYSQLIVSNDRVYSEITPRVIGKNETNSEIYVKWTNSIELEITARSSSKVLLEIDVKATNSVETSINITQDKLLVEIYPRVIGEDNKLTVIEPRINMVDNMPTIITVNGKNGAYGFIMG